MRAAAQKQGRGGAITLAGEVMASLLATELFEQAIGHGPKTALGRAWIAGSAGVIRHRLEQGDTFDEIRATMEVALGIRR